MKSFPLIEAFRRKAYLDHLNAAMRYRAMKDLESELHHLKVYDRLCGDSIKVKNRIKEIQE